MRQKEIGRERERAADSKPDKVRGGLHLQSFIFFSSSGVFCCWSKVVAFALHCFGTSNHDSAKKPIIRLDFHSLILFHIFALFHPLFTCLIVVISTMIDSGLEFRFLFHNSCLFLTFSPLFLFFFLSKRWIFCEFSQVLYSDYHGQFIIQFAVFTWHTLI